MIKNNNLNKNRNEKWQASIDNNASNGILSNKPSGSILSEILKIELEKMIQKTKEEIRDEVKNNLSSILEINKQLIYKLNKIENKMKLENSNIDNKQYLNNFLGKNFEF